MVQPIAQTSSLGLKYFAARRILALPLAYAPISGILCCNRQIGTKGFIGRPAPAEVSVRTKKSATSGRMLASMLSPPKALPHSARHYPTNNKGIAGACRVDRFGPELWALEECGHSEGLRAFGDIGLTPSPGKRAASSVFLRDKRAACLRREDKLYHMQ